MSSSVPEASPENPSECCPGGACGPQDGPSRRTFLTLGLTGLGMVAAPSGVAAALGLDPRGLVVVPAEKNLSPEVVRNLFARGTPTEYTGEALRRIGMPVGGGCTGQVYLAGDGRLWAWDIFNPGSFPLGGAAFEGPHYTRPLEVSSPFRQGFTLRTTSRGRTQDRTLDETGFPDVRFTGRYPIGTTTYRAPDSPVEVTRETFSPFIPLSVTDSTVPATVLAFTVRNTSRSSVRVELAGTAENPVCPATRRQQPVLLHAEAYSGDGLRGVEFSAADDTSPQNEDILFEDWESGFGDWTATGTAFGDGPVRPAELPAELRRFGDLTISGARFVTSHDFRGGTGDAATGTLTSREFTIERRYAAVSVGGGDQPGRTCVNVLVDGAVVASATGSDSEPMVARTLDLGEYAGRTARIELVDRSSGPWGHLNVDSIVFTDVPDILFEDWESGGYRNWTVAGDAFGAGPVAPADTPDYFRRPVGEVNDLNVSGTRFVTSHNYRDGGNADDYRGRLTSREFTIERRYVTAWVGGGGRPGTAGVHVLVGDEVVAGFTGTDQEPLSATSLDVGAWAGRRARIEIVDEATGGWGHVNVDRILFSDRPVRRRPLADCPDFGTFSLAALENSAATEVDGAEGATVAVPFTLAPGRSRTVRFALGWHFPTPAPGLFSWLDDGPTLKHHYNTRFAGADAVLRWLAKDRVRLEDKTRSWVRTWYEDSSLPHWFLERTLSTASTLATSTCFRFDNGRFYAWEGIYCCAGTCGHVWNYAQSVARLFPELERDTRQRVDLGLAMLPTGEIKNRGEAGEGWFADGQCGTILRVYREHQMSPDDGFLRRVWPNLRTALDWVVRADGDGDGILEGSQWNTLDAQWFGEVPWISGLYVAALRAGAAMAREVGDTAAAQRYDELAERGSDQLATELWNERYGYFFHRVDPAHPTSVNSNRGCYLDQLYGQTYAHQLGLPRVFPEDKTKTALRNIFRYNFLPDPAGHTAPGIPRGRVYADSGEPGTLMCTWPNGGSTETGQDGPVGYFNEVWTGQEYEFAAHLFAEGLSTEALAVTKAVDDRYSAGKRNPYNEIECSDHYARAMMSYGTYLAACGYEHHGPRGHLGFSPRLTPEDFRAAFTTAEGWGLYRQRREGGRQTSTVELRHGRLRLRTFAVEVPGSVTSAEITENAVNGTVRPPFTTAAGVTGTRVLFTLPHELVLTEGDRFEVTVSAG
ncbi:GH116 family glycosyl hydrolase [Amycolatopsis nigrescens]|uniref:GH116 family glycosyl hydrolase n=1 Tax=Amycolatopsis nigrescens TaxID=381445 RepID=UPI00036A37E2|nr:GH116 family glycosyl hydrolase [Amycolatopsis nigrescens]